MQTTPKKMEESSLTPPDLNALLSVCLSVCLSDKPIRLNSCAWPKTATTNQTQCHILTTECVYLSRRSYSAAAAAAAGDVQASIKAANKWISGRNAVHQKN